MKGIAWLLETIKRDKVWNWYVNGLIKFTLVYRQKLSNIISCGTDVVPGIINGTYCKKLWKQFLTEQVNEHLIKTLLVFDNLSKNVRDPSYVVHVLIKIKYFYWLQKGGDNLFDRSVTYGVILNFYLKGYTIVVIPLSPNQDMMRSHGYRGKTQNLYYFTMYVRRFLRPL